MFFLKKLFFLSIIYVSINFSLDSQKIIIFVHGEDSLPLSCRFFTKKKRAFIHKRWKKVENLAAEQRGLIDITSILQDGFLPIHYPIYFTKEQLKNFGYLTLQYNWDGCSYEQDMKKAACRLARDIRCLLKKYPHAQITFVAFSHGGNIVAQSSTLYKASEAIYYNNLIMLAPPIGRQTEQWLLQKRKRGGYVIKNVTVLSSQGDYTQIKDFLFNFPFCNKFLRKRTTNTNNFYIYFQHIDPFKLDSFLYHPNHDNFWIQKPLSLKEKIFHILPIIYFMPYLLEKERNNRLLTIDKKLNKIEIII